MVSPPKTTDQATAAMPIGTGDGLVQAVAAAVMIGCLVGAGFLARTVARQRQDLQLVMSLEGQQGMPPHVALATAALGTFRGLAVDVLWIRAAELQNLGQYFEAQTLAQWITSLQPRFPQVWTFQAHNLAYNISVASDVPSERWAWVDRGIRLLRDRGLQLNPSAPQLCDMLAFIFHNKVGNKVDQEHWYFKARVASDMQEVLGDLTAGKTTPEVIESFRRIAEAPDDLAAAAAERADLREVLDLMTAHGALPDEAFLRMVGRVIMADASRDGSILYGGGMPPGTNREFIAALRQQPELTGPLFEVILPHLQKKVLAEQYHMDTRRMLDLMERYGPLDWRHYDAHSIYWAEQGLEVSRRKLRREDINELLIVRTRMASIADLMRVGRIEYDGVTDRVDLLPDPRFIASYEAALQEVRRLIESEAGISAAGFSPAEFADLARGYERFLNEAVVLAYLYGDERKAAECFKRLVLLARDRGEQDQPIYRESLEMFVTLRMASVLKLDLSKIREFVDGMVQRALLDGLAKGRLDVFNKFIGMAFKVYERHQGSLQPDEKVLLKNNRLGSFSDLFATSFERMMTQNNGAVLERARIWALAPDQLKERSWAALEKTLVEQAAAAGLDPARAFPPPAGLVATTAGEPGGAIEEAPPAESDEAKAVSDKSKDGSDSATGRREAS
jgi:hypothetical protein